MEAIMSSKNGHRGPVAALMLPKQNKVLITVAKAIVDRMSNNPLFPSPTPTLASVQADITAFEDAEIQAASKAKGAAAARDAKARKVKEDLHHLRDYVQSVAEAQANPAAAAAVIESAFMTVRKPGTRTKPALRARNTGVSGNVSLDAKAVAHAATYYWQFSLDQQTWTNVPETMRAKALITGLMSARIHYFRFRALTRAGEIGFSQVVSLLVH
jgi:cell pole-organizing protein PopZ